MRVMKMCWCYAFKTPSSGYCCMVFVRYTLWINNIYNLQNLVIYIITLYSTSTFWLWCVHLDVQILLLRKQNNLHSFRIYIAFTLTREPTQKVLIQYVICRLIFYGHLTSVLIVFRQFYNLISVTTSEIEGYKSLKMTRITKKKAGSTDLPNITLCDFLKMAKEGIWWFVFASIWILYNYYVHYFILLFNIKYGCSLSYPDVCTNKSMTELGNVLFLGAPDRQGMVARGKSKFPLYIFQK